MILDLQGFTGVVTGLAISPNGSRLAAAGDKEVRVWDIESGELIATLRGERKRNNYGNCYTVAFSPDGKQLLVGIDDYTDDGSIRVYETGNLGEIRQLMAGHKAPVKQLAFSRDGRYLASAGENGTVLLWDWPAGRIVATVPPLDAAQPLFYSFNFPVEEPYLFTHGNSGSSVIRVPSGERLRPGSPIPNALRDWLVAAGQTQYPQRGEPSVFVLGLDRGVWLSGGQSNVDGRQEYWAASWFGAESAPRAVYNGHRYVVTAAALSLEGTLAATADVLGEVHLWQTANGRAKHVFRSLGRPVYRAALDVSSATVGYGSKPLPAGRWNRNSFGEVENSFAIRTRIASSSASSGTGIFPRELTERNGSRLQSVVSNGIYSIRTASAGVEAKPYRIRAGAAPMCYSFLGAGRLGIASPIVVGDDGGCLLCYDPTTNDERRDFIGHTSFVTSLSESADGRFLTTSSTDRTIRIWSLGDYRPTGDVDFKYLSDTVIEVDPGTSAAEAGIRVGDSFISMDGKNLTQLGNERLSGTYEYLPGQRVPVVMRRDATPYRAMITLKEKADLVEPCLSLFIADENDWVIWTPQGYYDASPRGDRLIGWHLNQGVDRAAKYYPAHVFRKQLYRPDIIDLALETGNVDEAIRRANAAHPRPTASIDLREPGVLGQLEPPKVSILAPTEGSRTDTSEITLRAEVESQNQLPVREVTVLVNGRPRGVKGIVREPVNAGLKRSIVRSLGLDPGENRISVIASNASSSSRPATVQVLYEPRKSRKSTVIRPDLYLLSIGISKYAREDLNLQFAHRDAQRFAEVWAGQEGHVYGQVKTKIITDEEASVQNILDGMDWLVKETTQRDVAVIFISAHGLRDSRNNYYLATHEIDPDSLRSTGVRFSEVKELLRDLPCKVILFVDTCHSGGITGNKTAGWDDPLRDLVSEEYGAVVFSSCLPREISLEDPRWQHGAFTKALLDTFSSSDSDNNGDGYLSLTELEEHVYQKVKQLTQGRQHPVVERPSTIRNFSFFFVGSKRSVAERSAVEGVVSK